ncbi:hypothetical protein CC1G_00706 [Coprinopsis cinerea okayama7|uniref:Uncharacterized protein n=1 Tax=Coprinopsis cinerea (strain Okayama-7 / 130 / ATCC MYA-4618 / FGSC 9003) TaxID=240176 RepID=A8N3T6_COPC7|nr:hypothetical protein CC1G_00706 [Coprinopsis cinerea okayama7\|eukprot:XP_001829527.2 hypothetical protein CC1G_00706 [Coprinopsis cinerea okayama7\
MNRDISLALEPSPPQAPAPPSRRSKDPRPKSYPNSQSYSSKLFELELSPIFEDIQVFGSTSLCGLDDDGADEAIPDHEHSPEPDSEVPRWRPTIDEDGESVDSERDRGSESDEEGSDSSYGQLVEEKRFGSAAYDVSVGQEDSDIEVEEFWVDTKEQYEEFSACVEEDFKGDIMETHQLVPALTFTSPTPEESSSSGMGDCSDVPQEGKMALEDPRTCRFASQVVDETVEEVRRVTPTQWTDTMESSVNTVDGRNVGAWKHVDEHGRLARPPPLVIDPPTARRSLKEAEGSETQTRKRWSMASYQSQSSRKSATWSIRSSTSSIWRRVSGALFRGSRVPGDAILEGSHEFVESSNAHQRSPQEGDATSLNGDFHRERERNTGTSTLGPTRALAAGRMANDSEAVPEYRLHGVKGVRERLRNLPRRMGALSGQGANASTRRGRLSSLLRSGGNETPGHRRSLPASTV